MQPEEHTLNLASSRAHETIRMLASLKSGGGGGEGGGEQDAALTKSRDSHAAGGESHSLFLNNGVNQ